MVQLNLTAGSAALVMLNGAAHHLWALPAGLLAVLSPLREAAPICGPCVSITAACCQAPSISIHNLILPLCSYNYTVYQDTEHGRQCLVRDGVEITVEIISTVSVVLCHLQRCQLRSHQCCP